LGKQVLVSYSSLIDNWLPLLWHYLDRPVLTKQESLLLILIISVHLTLQLLKLAFPNTSSGLEVVLHGNCQSRFLGEISPVLLTPSSLVN